VYASAVHTAYVFYTRGSITEECAATAKFWFIPAGARRPYYVSQIIHNTVGNHLFYNLRDFAISGVETRKFNGNSRIKCRLIIVSYSYGDSKEHSVSKDCRYWKTVTNT